MRKAIVAVPRGHYPPRAPYYSQAVKAEGAQLVFIAGQASLDEHGHVVGVGDIGRQLEQTLENMQLVLQEAGLSFDHVVRFLVFLRNREDIPALNEARAQLYPKYFADRAYPASSLIVVKDFVLQDMLLEIEATAVAD